MPTNNRGRKPTKAGSKPKPKPKGKGKVKPKESSIPTIADGDKATFEFRMPVVTGKPPVTPPQRASLPDVDTTPTRIRGKPSAEPAFSFDLTASGSAIDDNPFQDSSSHPGPPDHADSTRSRLKDLSQRAGFASDNFKSLTHSTPYATHGATPTMKGQTSRIEGIALAKSIGYAPTSGSGFITQQNFADGISDEAIQSWLCSKDSDGVYGAAWLGDKSDETRASFDDVWNLPEAAPEENKLYPFFEDILTAISDKFVQPDLKPGIERKLKDTHDKSLTHVDGETRTSPDFVVEATGPSFELPDDGKEVGYSNVTTFFDVKRDDHMTGVGILRQMGVYGRQIFAQQPNRIFVRGIIISEKRAQLIQFDRAGAQFSPFVSLNSEPEVFVRMVVEVFGGKSERSIGFDDSISWNIVDGRKDTGTLTFGPPGKERTYDLLGPRPVSHSFDIRGCATTVWAVTERGGAGEVFMVKDSWTVDGRTLEHTLLEITKNVKGVGKMVDFHVRGIKTSDFRCETTLQFFTDRQATRTMMEAHGRKIGDFTDPLEVLYALYDILIAHFEVYGMNILHRNITNKTVFLGSEDAAVGLRGVLIDFEAALNFDPESGDTAISKEARLGTRFYQSCMILRFLTELSAGEAPPHDHMDDLESVFNLVCFLFFTRRPDGKPRGKKDKARNVVRGWDSDKPDDALASKALFFSRAFGQKEAAIKLVSQSWGTACGTLFKQFWEWVWGIQEEKGEILRKHLEEQEELEQTMRIARLNEMEGHNIAEKKGEEPTEDGEQGGEAEEQNGDKGQEQEVTELKPAGEVDDDGDNPMVDEEEEEDDSEVLAVLEPTAPIPKKEVAFKKGLFAPLMENGMVGDHYNKVINFFVMAIAKIEVSPGLNGPRAIVADRPLKRKRGLNQTVFWATYKKLRRTPESNPSPLEGPFLLSPVA